MLALGRRRLAGLAYHRVGLPGYQANKDDRPAGLICSTANAGYFREFVSKRFFFFTFRCLRFVYPCAAAASSCSRRRGPSCHLLHTHAPTAPPPPPSPRATHAAPPHHLPAPCPASRAPPAVLPSHAACSRRRCQRRRPPRRRRTLFNTSI